MTLPILGGFFVRVGSLARLAFGSLSRQRGRTALTVVGVAVGTTALAFTLSLGLGLRAMVDREFETRPDFWHVRVYGAFSGKPTPEADIPPDRLAVPAGITGDRRERLRAALVRNYQESHAQAPPKPLTDAALTRLAALPDVTRVSAALTANGGVEWAGGGGKRHGTAVTLRSLAAAELSGRVVAGSLPATDAGDGLLIGEPLLLRMGLRTDAEFDAAIGREVEVLLTDVPAGRSDVPFSTLQLVGGTVSGSEAELLGKVTRQLPEAVAAMDLHPLEKALILRMLADPKAAGGKPKPLATASGRFRVAVVRDLTAEELRAAQKGFRYDDGRLGVQLPLARGRELFGELPDLQARGYGNAEMDVRPGGDLRAVVAAVEAEGFESYSSLPWYNSVKMEVTMIAGGLNLFAVVALGVAGIGIANTLATSVVERTREIGVLKAVGATRSQVLRLFLAEGTALGLVGGVLGALLAYALSWPADRFVSHLVTTQSQGNLKATTVFVWPLWLPVGTVLFTLVATTVAAYFPARRAASLAPVEALRAV
jgi:putative ABC transport system permease protein